MISRVLGCGVFWLLLVSPAIGQRPAISNPLLPTPRETHWSGASVSIPRLRVEVPGGDPEDRFAARELEDAARVAGVEVTRNAGYRVILLRAQSAEGKSALASNHLELTPEMKDEGYALAMSREHATVVASTSAGVFYGIQTLRQFFCAGNNTALLPIGTIRDWPAMKYRAIDDDLSRGPFPTMDFLKHQIRVFASFKANIYSPYMEHVLLYPQSPLTAPQGGSLTPEMVHELVAFARQYHVTIIPEQEAFGHLHHILKYEMYQGVAETPNGHVLSPVQDGTIALITGWFRQVAAEFPGPFMHIGADETFDLGQGRTKQAVAEKGYGPVYVDFLTQIHDALKPLNRRLLFWGDIGGSDPAAVAQLPKDMIAVPWNYWDSTGFEKMLEPFAKQNIETWVAPGDGNWNEVFPTNQTALRNIQGFVRDGQKMRSTGAMITVWNDDGEGLFNLDWYGVLFGAVAAWQPGESSIADYQSGYGLLFHGDRSGRIDEAEKKLMHAMSVLGGLQTGYNSDTLFWMDPWSQEGRILSAKILPATAEIRTDAEEATNLILQARRDEPELREVAALDAMEMGARRIDFIGLKFELAKQIAQDYADVYAHQQNAEQRGQLHNKLDEISSMFGRCQDLRDGYSMLKSAYSRVWLGENTPYWLDNVTVRYDLRIQEWQRRGERFRESVDDFEHHRAMPSPEAMGLPVLSTAQK